MEAKLKVRKRVVERLISPLAQFARQEASSGILLIVCALVAVIWTNSSAGPHFVGFWQTPVGLFWGSARVEMSLIHWINDGLMAVFFLLVGLEIKREILIGELSTVRRAALPFVAAVGGMVAPALIYAAFNYGAPQIRGWGIPMATDIAFALGVLALLGSRVPFSLQVFLTAVAIVDDLGAVLVIALFYSHELNLQALAIAGAFFAALLVANRLEVRSPLAYGFLGVGLWIGVFGSGIHATLAGVLLAMAIPTRVHLHAGEFVEQSRDAIDVLEESSGKESRVLLGEVGQSAIHTLERACELAQMPLERMSNAIEGWVTFLIVPIFALANAGVRLSDVGVVFSDPIGLGILFGLVIGKPVGITLFAWLAVKAKLADLPKGVAWRHIIGVGTIAGIGFTMSLFITNLAFSEPGNIEKAKMAILLASLVAGTAGLLMLLGTSRRSRVEIACEIEPRRRHGAREKS